MSIETTADGGRLDLRIRVWQAKALSLSATVRHFAEGALSRLGQKIWASAGFVFFEGGPGGGVILLKHKRG